MKIVSRIKNITVNNYINEINESIDNKNYLSALTIALIIPDICCNYLGEKRKYGYIKWFNKYVFRSYYDFPKNKEIKKLPKEKQDIYKIKFNGYVCYALRCAILHSGNAYIQFKNENDKVKAHIDEIELCVNEQSDRDNQYGEAVSILTSNDGTKNVKIRINTINFIDNIINGYTDFLNEKGIKDIKLFSMIDWDKQDINKDKE